jgi:hypothetical protein
MPPETGVNTSDIPISSEDRREVEMAADQMNSLECHLNGTKLSI